MTVSKTLTKNQWDGDGETETFAYQFLIHEETDLTVVITDVDEQDTTQVLDTDYSVDSLGGENGGTITFNTAPLATDTVTIYRDIPQKQLTNLHIGGSIAEPAEEQLDRQCMMIQELQEALDRCAQDSITGNPIAPGTGNSFVTLDYADDRYVASVSGYIYGLYVGTDAPGTTTPGRLYFNSSSGILYIREKGDSAWKIIGDYDNDYGGLLLRTAGSGMALSGDLYLGTNQVKGVSDPTADTDAATQGWTNTQIGLIELQDIDYATGQTDGAILVANGSNGTVMKMAAVAEAAQAGVSSAFSLTSSYQDVVGATVAGLATTQTVLVQVGFECHGSMSATFDFRVLDNQSVALISKTGISTISDGSGARYCSVSLSLKDTTPDSGSNTYKLQIRAPAGTSVEAHNCSISALALTT